MIIIVIEINFFHPKIFPLWGHYAFGRKFCAVKTQLKKGLKKGDF